MGRKRRGRRGRGKRSGKKAPAEEATSIETATDGAARPSPGGSRRRFGAVGATLLAIVLLVAYVQFARTRSPAAGALEIPRLTALDRLDPWVSEAIAEALAAVERGPSGRAYGRLGRLYLAHELYDLARRCFEIAERLEPHAAEWPYYQALHFQERGETEAAVACFRRTLELRPDYAAARFRLGDTLLAAGRLAEARTAFLALAESAETEPVARLGLARVARREGHLEEARRQLEAVAADSNPEAVYLLAMTQRELGHEEEAARTLASWRPDNARAHASLPDPFVAQALAQRLDPRNFTRTANAHLQAGRLDQAERLLERVLDIDPREYEALFNLGLLRGRQGRYEESERLLRRAVDVAPENPDSHFGLATAFAAQGRLDEARSEIESSLELQPDHPGALELRSAMTGQREVNPGRGVRDPS